MRANKLLVMIAAGISSMPTVGAASDFLNATIEFVRPDNYDIGGVFVKLRGARSGTEACPYPDGGSNNWYFITTNNGLMKELLGAAISAKLSDKTVNVVGSGTCTRGYEDVRYIQIN